MNALVTFNGGDAVTMTSREIAELTGKEHKNVMADIRKMLDELGKTLAEFSADLPDSYGRLQPCFKLPKDETICLMAGYDVKARMAIIKRWQELEEKTRSNVIAMPNFSNPAEAARAFADQYEARLLAEKTKAEIGTRREATAMNTASQAVKKVTKLEIELDKSMQYATVKRMEMLYHGQKFNWRLLKSTGAEMGVEAIEIFDANYGTVKSYHADVWREAYALDIDPVPEREAA